MQAVILAGGFGTRVKSILGDTPKPMALVRNGTRAVPFLEILLTNLLNQKVEKVVIAVHHLKEQIMDYFGNAFEGMVIQYSVEEEPLGTGGAIGNALSYIDDDKFLVLNGDTFLECDYKQLFDHHGLTIVLRFMNDCSRYGKVELNDSKVIRFIEKGQHGSGLINGGAYLVYKKNIENCPSKFSFETDFLYKHDGINAYISNGYFIDIGVPEDYERAQKELCKNVFF